MIERNGRGLKGLVIDRSPHSIMKINLIHTYKRNKQSGELHQPRTIIFYNIRVND